MSAYYNESDAYAAEWLRNLIRDGLIAPGHVDGRSIRDVQPADLDGFEQVHLFAGIGGWSYALRLAGWPDDRPIWTGSCPCQPFSAAGHGLGFDDERHLWPEFVRLVRERRPPVVAGEQVAGQDGLSWLDLVSADLEAAGYTFAAADLCAAGVSAPHIRSRLYWLAHADRIPGGQGCALDGGRDQRSSAAAWPGPGGGRGSSRLGDAHGGRCEESNLSVRQPRQDEAAPLERGPDFWSACDWIPCADGLGRPVEPGTFPLADGVSNRVGKIRAYGNAIVPQVAAEFLSAYMETI